MVNLTYVALGSVQTFKRSGVKEGETQERLIFVKKIAWMRAVPKKQANTQNISAEDRQRKSQKFKGL